MCVFKWAEFLNKISATRLEIIICKKNQLNSLYYVEDPKGTVSVISRDRLHKDSIARFTTVSLKRLSDKKCEKYFVFPEF